MLKIKVDTTLCSGHARCAVIAPAIYKLDDNGYCVSDGEAISEENEQLAQRGARACPERAITLIRE